MENIFVSFSGGRTSAYLAYMIKNRLFDYPVFANVVYVFANTGQEHPKTLEFVRNVDKHFNLGVVWVEAVFNEYGKGTTHKIVDYGTACRSGKLFVKMCEKYGLPNPDYPHCTRELKIAPMNSFAKEYFNGEKYTKVIGIRADECLRASNDKIWYPLVDDFVTKNDILSFWEKQSFDLGLKDYQGNCTWCWKKSDKKLYGIYKENKNFLKVPRMLEKYSEHGHRLEDKPHRKMFRKERTIDQVISDYENKSSTKHPKMF